MNDAQKFWYLFWAYNIIWILIGVYLVSLGVRQRRIRRLIDQLRDMIGGDGDGA